MRFWTYWLRLNKFSYLACKMLSSGILMFKMNPIYFQHWCIATVVFLLLVVSEIFGRCSFYDTHNKNNFSSNLFANVLFCILIQHIMNIETIYRFTIFQNKHKFKSILWINFGVMYEQGILLLCLRNFSVAIILGKFKMIYPICIITQAIIIQLSKSLSPELWSFDKWIQM